ncbi:c-type cytochrome, partial [Akkermansiaceae bacterium]|nr:c-type cytochrome [Akkermansiaceae bacterium]
MSPIPPGDAARGKNLVATLNCSSCHEGLEASKNPAPNLADLKDWTKSCLGPEDQRGNSPRLILTEEQKKAITPAILPALKHDTVEAYTSRQIEALNCTSCHAYNGKDSLLTKTHGETKSLLD